MLHESEGRIPYAYFPLTGVVAKLNVLESGESADNALIGNEGIVGFPLVLGGESTPSRAMVLSTDDVHHRLQQASFDWATALQLALAGE